jgi:hypothetical protein
MKKYGLQPQHPGNLPDNHPPKGHVMWWETENHNGKSKKRARREAKQEINEQI